jgi:glycosyltransferase involved in cell wall biosynthesis
LRRHLLANRARLANQLKFLRGYLTGYPVYRPIFDHTVYESDNRELGSTYLFAAKLTHSPSCTGLKGPAVIEFEHPFALIGHIDDRTDYNEFRADLKERFSEFCAKLDARVHRLLGSSKGALQHLGKILAKTGCRIDERCVAHAYWAIRQRRSVIPQVRGTINVFHYGRAHPGYKGTRDVLALSKLFPKVQFQICIDTTLPIVKEHRRQDNITFIPTESKRGYDRALASSHILLNPLYGDGWGVVLEAIALAMPIIGYATYDKQEAVEHDRTGFLVECPTSLSLYDGFFDPGYRNLHDFECAVLSSDNNALVARLAEYLDRYVEDRELLHAHSENTGQLFRRQFSVARRLKTIRSLYVQILEGLQE